MNLKQKALRGVFWSAVESWGSRLISTTIFFVLARQLGPEAFGVVALAGVYIAFAQVFIDQGFSQAIIQFNDIERTHLDTAFWTNIIVGTFLTTVSVLCASWISLLFNEGALEEPLRWLSLMFMLSALSNTQQAILQRELLFRVLAVRSFLATSIGGVVGILMAAEGFGIWSLVGQQLSNRVAQAAILWFSSDWRPRFAFSMEHFAELWNFGSNVMGISILNFFNRRADDFLIGYFLGPVALGYYTVAYKFLLVLTDLITRTTSKVALPVFSKIQTDLKKIRLAFYKVTSLTSLIAFPAFAILAILAPEIISSIFGQKWEPSIPVMQILSITGIVHSISFFNGVILIAMGKPEWKLRFGIANTIVNVSSFLIVARWGIVSVSIAYTIRALLFLPISTFLSFKVIKFNIYEYLRQYSVPFISCIFMTVSVLGVRNFTTTGGYRTLLLNLFVGISVYAIAATLLKPSLIRELRSCLPIKS